MSIDNLILIILSSHNLIDINQPTYLYVATEMHSRINFTISAASYCLQLYQHCFSTDNMHAMPKSLS